jgi:hypothetical protein
MNVRGHTNSILWMYAVCWLRQVTLIQFSRRIFGPIAYIHGTELIRFRKVTLKVPKCEIFDPFLFTPKKSYMGRWLEDWINSCFFFEDYGSYSPFFFFCSCWACAKKLPTQAECALKKTGNKFTHTLSCANNLPTHAEPALKKGLRRLSLR